MILRASLRFGEFEFIILIKALFRLPIFFTSSGETLPTVASATNLTLIIFILLPILLKINQTRGILFPFVLIRCLLREQLSEGSERRNLRCMRTKGAYTKTIVVELALFELLQESRHKVCLRSSNMHSSFLYY